jgi:hypothetical protein
MSRCRYPLEAGNIPKNRLLDSALENLAVVMIVNAAQISQLSQSMIDVVIVIVAPQ